MRRVARVAQCAVDQFDVVLVDCQDGDSDALAPVQMQILGNSGLSGDIRILLRRV